MPVIRILLLLLVLAGLALLLTQNWAPVISLVFLGIKTPALPLALWILISLAAGAITALVVTSLLKISNYWAARQRLRLHNRNQQKQVFSSNRSRDSSASNSPPPNQTKINTDAGDDWDNEDSGDWKIADDDVKDSNPSERQQPNSNYQSGSDSYGHREPKNSGVGRTESIYDADYRVITPPYQQKEVTKKNEEDDWGFLDDDDEM